MSNYFGDKMLVMNVLLLLVIYMYIMNVIFLGMHYVNGS